MLFILNEKGFKTEFQKFKFSHLHPPPKHRLFTLLDARGKFKHRPPSSHTTCVTFVTHHNCGIWLSCDAKVSQMALEPRAESTLMLLIPDEPLENASLWCVACLAWRCVRVACLTIITELAGSRLNTARRPFVRAGHVVAVVWSFVYGFFVGSTYGQVHFYGSGSRPQ